MIVHDLFDQLFILGWFYLHGKDPLTHTQHTESDVLRCDQGVIVKQRNLYTASADIHDRSPLLNDLLEAFALGSDRLIIQEALFGITEYFYIQSCPVLDHIQNDQPVFRLPERARCIGSVSIHLISTHDLFKFF